MKAAIYARQSIDQAEGIDGQVKRCRALITAKGWIEADLFLDNATSASKTRGEGTAWARMLESANRGAFDVVVAVDLDRLLRNTRDLTTLIDSGARVLTVDGEIDLTTADGEFRATMLAGIARFEVRRKSERQKRATERKAAAGTYDNGSRPFGYALDDRKKLHPVEAPLIQAAYRTILDGGSIYSIIIEWREKGVPTMRPRKGDGDTEAIGDRAPTWSHASIRALLLRERNAGRVVHRGKLLPGVRGGWEPLVSEEEFDAARAILTAGDRRKNAGAKPRHLLGGLIACATCGGMLRSNTQKDMRRADPKTLTFYRCSGLAERPAGGQAHASIRADIAEAEISKHVFGALVDRFGGGLEADAIPPEITGLLAERAELTAERERWTLALGIQGVSVGAITKELGRIGARLEVVAAAVDEASRDRARRAAVALAAEFIATVWDDVPDEDMLASQSAVMGRFEEHWQGLSLAEKRELIRGTLTVTAAPMVAVRAGTAERLSIRYNHRIKEQA